MKVSTAITDGGGSWTATDTMDTPQGTATDTATLAKSTLTLQKRSLKQGPVAIDIDFAGNKAAAKVSMNGQDQPIAVDLGGPLFADAAGSDQVIACLPLAEGYTTTFRNFDIQTQKVKLLQLKVAGVENVTVPAGTFDAYRVEISSADGGHRQEDDLGGEGFAQGGESQRRAGLDGRRGDDRGADRIGCAEPLTALASFLVKNGSDDVAHSIPARFRQRANANSGTPIAIFAASWRRRNQETAIEVIKFPFLQSIAHRGTCAGFRLGSASDWSLTRARFALRKAALLLCRNIRATCS